VKSTADLKDKPICVIQGSFYNSRIQSEFTGQDLVAFKGVPENEQALLSGQCTGFLYDDTLMTYKKRSEAEKWANFDVVALTEFKPLPWGLAVKFEDKEGAWGNFMSATLTDWLKSGTLLALEKKWLARNTKWLEDETEKARQ
jgi:polar amino acid transport system substrate-binding protein